MIRVAKITCELTLFMLDLSHVSSDIGISVRRHTLEIKGPHFSLLIKCGATAGATAVFSEVEKIGLQKILLCIATIQVLLSS